MSSVSDPSEAGATTPEPATYMRRLRVGLRRLFYGRRPAAVRFQVGLLALDLAAVAYFVAGTFVRDAPWLRAADLLLGVLLACEFLGRMLAHRGAMHHLDSGASWRYLDNGAAIIDLLVIASLFVTAALGTNLGFLRLLRTARLLRSYNVLERLKNMSPAVARNEEVLRAALDLAVFVLIASSLVYVTQHGTNKKIVDFVDALYFTVAALSTTGFGDITLIGSTSGELLSVAMMIVGITLFFRLAHAAFRPGGKVRHPCPQCGLLRHDPDAVHCKACGRVLSIPDDEEWARAAARNASAGTPSVRHTPSRAASIAPRRATPVVAATPPRPRRERRSGAPNAAIGSNLRQFLECAALVAAARSSSSVKPVT